MAGNHIPVYGDAVSWVYENAQEAVLKHYTKDEEEAAKLIEENRKDYLDSGRQQSAKAMKQAFIDAAKQERISTAPGTPGGQAADVMFHSVNTGFADGKTR